MKYIRPIVLLLLLAALVALPVFGAETVASGTEGDLSWVITDDGTLTISGTGPIPDNVRPWRDHSDRITRVVVEPGITELGKYTLAYLDRAAEILLPETLTAIRAMSVRGCEALTSIVIPEGVTLIGDSAFEKCPLETIHLPATLSELDNRAFQNMPTLRQITVAEGNPDYAVRDGLLYRTIGPYRLLELVPNVFQTLVLPEDIYDFTQTALSGCTLLEELTVCNGKDWVPGNLNRCSSLKNIYVHDTNEHFISVDGVIYSKDRSTLVRYPAGRTGDYTVPEGTAAIGSSSFEGSAGLTDITLPQSLLSIDVSAFRDCTGLTRFTVPERITQIRERVFYGCENLQTLTLPDTVTLIDAHAFAGCLSLEQLRLPQSLTELGEYAFYRCQSLSQLELNTSLSVIGDHAFNDSALTEVVLPESVTYLGKEAFGSDVLTLIHALGDAPEISEDPFFGMEQITLCYPRDASGWDRGVWAEYDRIPCDYSFRTQPATCTECGAAEITCPHCDLRTELVLPASGHSFDAWFTAVEPTEETEGRWDRVCALCGDTESITVPPAPQEPMASINLSGQDYQTYGLPIQSYLIPQPDGTVQRLEYYDKTLTLESYDAGFHFLSRRSLPMELPLFGGFYEGKDHYFLVFGQENLEETDATEVIRVVRYSKDWVRQEQASLFGANTQIPFDAGSLRMVQYGDMLYLHTSHQMYKDIGNVNHQANLMLSIFIPEMRITDQLSRVANNTTGYVSHSFNQFLLIREGKLLTLNHGDAHPRAAVIMEFSLPAGEKRFVSECTKEHILEFYGDPGNNYTGASLGGFCLSDGAILTAGNSADQSPAGRGVGARNIFLAVTDPDALGADASELIWITDYPADSELHISTPHLVPIHEDLFLLLWTEGASRWDRGLLRYVFVDGLGQMTSPIYEADGRLSDCVPVVANGQVLWYVTGDEDLAPAAPVFCSIDLNAPETVHTVPEQNPCADGHSWDGLTCTRCGETRENPFGDVAVKEWYFEPVLWAVENGITSGTSATAFAPNATCTRAQVVTFLWRAMGKPEPESGENSFSDVMETDYFYKAVLWAVENGITSGTGGGKFSPNNPCTRNQVVTFLWRTMGQPEPESTDNPFNDVPEGIYYYNPVLWAVENNITSGIGAATFAPNADCTRAQVVTFLYRALKDK